jgi:hypothetical protein
MGKVFCGALCSPLAIPAYGGLSPKTSPTGNPFLYGAGKQKQLVVATSVRMQLC